MDTPELTREIGRCITASVTLHEIDLARMEILVVDLRRVLEILATHDEAAAQELAEGVALEQCESLNTDRRADLERLTHVADTLTTKPRRRTQMQRRLRAFLEGLAP